MKHIRVKTHRLVVCVSTTCTSNIACIIYKLLRPASGIFERRRSLDASRFDCVLVYGPTNKISDLAMFLSRDYIVILRWSYISMYKGSVPLVCTKIPHVGLGIPKSYFSEPQWFLVGPTLHHQVVNSQYLSMKCTIHAVRLCLLPPASCTIAQVHTIS